MHILAPAEIITSAEAQEEQEVDELLQREETTDTDVQNVEHEPGLLRQFNTLWGKTWPVEVIEEWVRHQTEPCLACKKRSSECESKPRALRCTACARSKRACSRVRAFQIYQVGRTLGLDPADTELLATRVESKNATTKAARKSSGSKSTIGIPTMTVDLLTWFSGDMSRSSATSLSVPGTTNHVGSGSVIAGSEVQIESVSCPPTSSLMQRPQPSCNPLTTTNTDRRSDSHGRFPAPRRLQTGQDTSAATSSTKNVRLHSDDQLCQAPDAPPLIVEPMIALESPAAATQHESTRRYLAMQYIARTLKGARDASTSQEERDRLLMRAERHLAWLASLEMEGIWRADLDPDKVFSALAGDDARKRRRVE